MGQPFALIVEDERDLAALIRYVMDIAGYQTDIAFTAEDTLERLNTYCPDIVLLDLNLPGGMSGGRVLEAVRKDPRMDQTRVIVMTAYSHMAEGLSVDPDLLLLKPVNIEQFSELVGRLQTTLKSSKTIPFKDLPWDKVTGLYNRSFFVNRLDVSLNKCQETSQCLAAVVSLSLDRDENIKGQLDIKRWISLLRETADTLRTTVRPTDTIARFDQDVFYVLIENFPGRQIPLQIATRIRDRLKIHLKGLEGELLVPFRIGLALCDDSTKNADTVIREVDDARSHANAQDVFPSKL